MITTDAPARTGRPPTMLHPMVDPRIADAQPPLMIARGDGCHVYDADGRRYLDTVAALWNVNVGHNRPEVKRAIVEQLDRIAYYSTFVNTSNPPAAELAARLVRLFEPERIRRVLFSSGGSDAVETAIKLARQYWKLRGQGGRVKILSLKLGYHGVHFGGASANGNPVFRSAYEPLMPGFFQVDAPYRYRNPWNCSEPAALARAALAALEREIQHQGPGTIAAFIAEPVQGAGGVIVPPPDYWPGLRRLLDRHEILLVADEVVTAFGRIGSMSGARHWGVVPDLIATAKGINSGYVPLGATLVGERVARAWSDAPAGDPLAALMHGYTYSGHPLACAAANANLDIIEHDDLPANAARMGERLLDGLAAFATRPLVGDVRGLGLMAALELVEDKTTKAPIGPESTVPRRLIAAARRHGAILRIQGNRLILSPPLVISAIQVDELLSILAATFDDVEAGR